MKRTIGLALMPVMLASLPLVAMAEPMQHQGHEMKTTTTTMRTTTETRTMGQWDKSQWDKAVWGSTDPRVQEWGWNGQWNLVTRHYPEAINAFQSILGIAPDSVHALDGLATALFFQGRYDEALQQVNRAIALDPVNARLFWTKGQILDAKDMPREALESYMTFTALNPDDGAALMANRRADELMKRVDSQLNESWRAYFKGLQYLSLHQPQRATEQFQKFIAAEPNNVNAHILLGRSFLELGQPTEAIPHFEAAIRTQANSPVAYYHLWNSYDLTGQTQNAKTAWDKFVQFAPKSEAAMMITRRTEVIRR